MRRSGELSLAGKIRLDNQFRFAVSLATIAVASILHSVYLLPAFRSLLYVWGIYSFTFLVPWWWLRGDRNLTMVRYFLSVADFAGITATVSLTGGPQSAFYYLYPIPFLVHALDFEVNLIVWDGALSVLCYGGLLWLQSQQAAQKNLDVALGQLVFLSVIIGAALATARRFRAQNDAMERSVKVLRTSVQFLEAVNALAPGSSRDELQSHILNELREVLRPFRVFPRLWVADRGWKTLHALGEHPALRPGSSHHLPMSACPAYALRQAFRYSQTGGEPCPSEQFNYAKHLCLPISNEDNCFGVLFLCTYEPDPWDAEELHLFEMLAQSIALAVHRKTLFETLQEKISELNFSFEVGAASLATFGGSTQSIDETTIHILDSVLSILKADRASLMLWDARSHCLLTQWVRGGDFKIQSPMRLPMGEGMAGWALKTREPYWAEYAMGDPHYILSAQPVRSLLCVPVYTLEDKPLGVINVVTTQAARVFSEREINFIKSFGRQAALAIENAKLHHKTRANVEQLRELNQMKSQFLSLVSHDLRGPLTGVRGFCEVLKQQSMGRLSPAQMDLLDQLERQVDLQERMVDDLLDLARMEKGQLSIHPHPTDILGLLREEVDKSQREARDHRVTLTFSLLSPEPFPPVMADNGRIRQVVWNLLHNALKFTPEQGRVRVSVGHFGDAVSIVVEDTGVGLSADVQERVFDKFFQISPGGSKGAQGLGLGLAICKEIVLAHHGQIRAQSPGLGLGTTISFTLPVQKGTTATSASAAA